MASNQHMQSDQAVPASPDKDKWEHEESIVVPVDRELIWKYWTDMRHHEQEDGVERIELDGPFVTGTKGRTFTPHGKDEWELTAVRDEEQFGIRGYTPDRHGSLTFFWRLEDDGDGTRLTYRLTALGPDVEENMAIFEGMGKRMPEALATLKGWLEDFAAAER